MTVDWTEPSSSTDSWRGTTLAPEYVDRQRVAGVELYQRRNNVSETQLLIECISKTINYHIKSNQSNHQTIITICICYFEGTLDLFFGSCAIKCSLKMVLQES